MSKLQDTPELVSGIASAPGDIPMPAINKRNALKSVQLRHDNSIIPNCPSPEESVTVTATSGAGMDITRVELWYTTDGSWPDANSTRLAMQIADVTWDVRTSYLNEWHATIPPQPDGTIVRYRIAGFHGTKKEPVYFAHDGMGFWFRLGEAGVTTFAYRVRASQRHFPEWMDDVVIYHIFLDRFRGDAGQLDEHEDPFARHGGTIQGVIDALPYLADLGITCLWFSPMGLSESYHRYDQQDFVAIDPDLGTEADVRKLAARAKALGMRLILDYVPSHASWKMPQFEAARADQNAPTAGWFVFDEWPDKYRCFLNTVPSLVSLNGNDEGLRQYIIDSAIYWLCELGFDGIRLDHVIGHGMDFWAVFSQAVEKAKPDAAIFGEATDTPPALRAYSGRLQGILDFPLAQALRMSFGLGAWSINDLNGMFNAYNRFMADGPGRVSFLDNHDMDRFLYVAGQDTRRLKMGLLCLLTLPYTPVIYYGTEVGLSQPQSKDDGGFGGDHVIRANMPWDETSWDANLLAFTKEAIALRQAHQALRTGQWETALADNNHKLFGYRMIGKEETICVLFNLGEAPQTVSLEMAVAKTLLATNDETALKNSQTVTLAPLSGIALLG